MAEGDAVGRAAKLGERAWFCAMPPTCALASPQPVSPHSVSMRTIVPSNDSVRP
jgi:hypothetical protein